jgi:manganese/zinc/iron transport system permease protein
MVALAAFFGALSGVLGAVISSTTTGIPTGPTIVLAASVVVALSLTLAPRRGLVWHAVRRARSRRVIEADAVLSGLDALSAHHADSEHGHSAGALDALEAIRGDAARTLRKLQDRGLVRQVGRDRWVLTADGRHEVETMRSRRFEQAQS